MYIFSNLSRRSLSNLELELGLFINNQKSSTSSVESRSEGWAKIRFSHQSLESWDPNQIIQWTKDQSYGNPPLKLKDCIGIYLCNHSLRWWYLLILCVFIRIRNKTTLSSKHSISHLKYISSCNIGFSCPTKTIY